MVKLSKIITVLLFATIIFIGCDNKEEVQLAKVNVSLIDAPADYEAVQIEIKDVQVNIGEDEKGWKSLKGFKSSIYDVLKLTNGEEAFLGEIELPQGKLSQVRLILGENNKLRVKGQEFDLKVPSGTQSGLKLNVGASIVAGVTYKLVLDFDASKSIVKKGNKEEYNLKPVVRAQMEAQTGAIKGVIEPKELNSVVYAINSKQDTISTYPNKTTGGFLVRALPTDTYKVVIIPNDLDTYNKSEVESVEVKAGEVNDVKTLTISKK